MEPAAILHALTHDPGLPRKALAAATERREEMTPLFFAEIDAWLAADSKKRAEPTPLFYIFHLFGQWREKAAYRPLARLLRTPFEDFDPVLGETTETAHRVMASVFDGDPQPLYDVILDPQADEFARIAMFETLAMLAHWGRLDRSEVVRFVTEAHDRIEPRGENPVWVGWVSAVAMLRLPELTEKVRGVFERGFIEPMAMHYSDFERDLAAAIARPHRLVGDRGNRFAPFGEVAKEMARWHFAIEADRRRDDDAAEARIGAFMQNADFDLPLAPFLNDLRDVGRNDPCPCGSGRKYKKCCGR